MLQFLYNYIGNIFKPNIETTNQTIRIQFGSALPGALELLLGDDIHSTAISPTWNEKGKLLPIAVLRTSLNFFLERELKVSGLQTKKIVDSGEDKL